MILFLASCTAIHVTIESSMKDHPMQNWQIQSTV